MKISGALGAIAVEWVTPRGTSAEPDASNSSSNPVADSLSLSAEARARAAAATHPRFGVLSVAVHEDPALARQLAYDYAHLLQQPLIDLTDQIAGTGPAKYAATGEPVTPERDAYYKSLAQDLQAKSLSLYNQEMARGTDEADIFDKLIALTDKAPAELRDIINWELKLG